jgi:threonine dehydrogenase-like Zn-dependent dehydrogenase
MRQIVLDAPRQFVGQVVPPVVSQPGEALVRIHRVVICGSDWHAFDGHQANYTFPRIIGHELSCEVLGCRKIVAASGPETGVPSSLT